MKHWLYAATTPAIIHRRTKWVLATLLLGLLLEILKASAYH